MKHLFYAFAIIFFASCNDKKLDITVKTYLSNEQASKLKLDVVRYVEDLPRLAKIETKFDTVFDKDYKKLANRLELLNAYKNLENDTLYFAVSKIAPSLKLKKNATVGKLVYDKEGKISFYEEGFRTWKMEVLELETVTEMLFQKYIQNQNLSEFYTKNSNGKFIIEFPDDYNKYDREARRWIFTGDSSFMVK